MKEYACALLVNDGHLLLGKRAPYRKTCASKWDVIGGCIEQGETREAALHRELQEEIAIVPQAAQWFATLSDPDVTPEDPPLYHFFRLEHWSGTPVINNNEHTELAWFPLRQIGSWPDLARPEYPDLFARLADFYSRQ